MQKSRKRITAKDRQGQKLGNLGTLEIPKSHLPRVYPSFVFSLHTHGIAPHTQNQVGQL